MRRDVEFKIKGVKFCQLCSKSEVRVAVYLVEFEKVVVKVVRGTLTYVFNQGSIKLLL